MAQLKSVQDQLLTNVSNKLVPDGYVSDQVLPMLPVAVGTGKIGNYGNGHLQIVTTLMGGKGKAPRVNAVTRSSNGYAITRHGLESTITPDDFANAVQPFDARRDETEALTTMLWLAREKSLADTLTSTSTITQNVTLSGSSQFSDFANSDPLGKFLTARSTIRGSVGVPPNTAIMDWAVAETLRYHPGILEALGFNRVRSGQLSDDELASALKVDRLLISRAFYNSANEGQTASIGPVWSKDIVFAVCPATASKMQVSLGYDVEFANRGPRQVFRAPVNNPPESEEIVVVDDYQYVIVNANAAYVIKAAIA